MELLMYRDHPAVRIGGNEYVVDTGSGRSFNYLRLRSLSIGPRTYPFWHEKHCSKSVLDELTGRDMAGIIGLDVISETGLTIDLEHMTLDFAALKEDEHGPLAVLPFDRRYGVVTTDAVSISRRLFDHRLQNAIIDTGAIVPYISQKHFRLLKETGETYEDSSPMFGRLAGEYRAGDIVLDGGRGKRTRAVRFGKMPQNLESMRVFDAVLGVSALTDRRIVFDFSRMEIRAWL